MMKKCNFRSSYFKFKKYIQIPLASTHFFVITSDLIDIILCFLTYFEFYHHNENRENNNKNLKNLKTLCKVFLLSIMIRKKFMVYL